MVSWSGGSLVDGDFSAELSGYVTSSLSSRNQITVSKHVVLIDSLAPYFCQAAQLSRWCYKFFDLCEWFFFS